MNMHYSDIVLIAGRGSSWAVGSEPASTTLWLRIDPHRPLTQVLSIALTPPTAARKRLASFAISDRRKCAIISTVDTKKT